MIKKAAFIFLTFTASICSAYTDKQVLVHINIARQSDTMGFNMVYELENFFYNMIQSGHVTLWDSPKKQVRISAGSLEQIEKSSATKFNKSLDVFLHEFWSSNARKTTFTIIGASFINQSAKGKVDYGFIDFSECWSLMHNFFIDCNVNGPGQLRLTDALYSRNYNYNIVQFGRKTFRSKPEEAIKIRDKAFFSNRRVDGLYKMPVTKDVRYAIEPLMSELTEIGNVVFINLQDFLNNNKEVLFNIGAGNYFDYKTFKSEISVTRVEVRETWTKKDDYIDYNVRSVTIYVNNKPLDPVSLDVILNWNLLFQFKTLEDVLKEKKFRYNIIKLNNTYVTEEDSPKFIKSLEKYSWTQVSRYVKFY